MKVIHIMLVLVLYIYSISCHTQTAVQSTTTNRESVDSRGNLILLGKSTKERLQQEPFSSWFNKNYQDYEIDSATAEKLKTKLKNKRFVIFMGTWCGDSRQEVPKIYRLLEYCAVPTSNIQLVNLDIHDSVYKQSPTHEEKGLDIHRVPDLLIYENKTEIGRIVEKPVNSWERDLLAIVEGEKYQHNYPVVAHFQKLFQSVSVDKIEKHIAKIADSLKLHITKNEGLQSYGTILLADGQHAKALIILRLNTLLYPASANGFAALGDAYIKTAERSKAKENYDQALRIQPTHEKAAMMLTQLMK
ncbi:MAG: thioredoxin family protein [Chitinophagaceae bacterium]|nr:thioredoxin family protein [Chitinophagaceae bacterium]